MGRVEWALLILLSALWGAAFFFGKVAVRELSPFTVVFVRVSLAALILNGVLLLTGQRLPRFPGRWGEFMILGLFNNAVPFSLIFWGQTRIASGLASILNATTPAWGILLAHLWTEDEKLTPNKVLGVVLGLCGAVTLIGWDILFGERGNVLAQLAVLGAALSYAATGIYAKRFKGTAPLVLATVQISCAALWMLPVALLTFPSGQRFDLSLPVVLSVLGLAVLSTALAYLIYFRVLASAGASNVLLVTLLIPVSANALGALVLGERVGVEQVLGMMLIGLGLAVIDGRVVAALAGSRKYRAASARADPEPPDASVHSRKP
jgi:drug/metabolite transporter (DMT)-like permease